MFYDSDLLFFILTKRILWDFANDSHAWRTNRDQFPLCNRFTSSVLITVKVHAAYGAREMSKECLRSIPAIRSSRGIEIKLALVTVAFRVVYDFVSFSFSFLSFPPFKKHKILTSYSLIVSFVISTRFASLQNETARDCSDAPFSWKFSEEFHVLI